MNENNYNQYNLQPISLESVSNIKSKNKIGLKILKWVGISFGIFIILVILLLTWFSLETSGTFMRMREQPKLLTELKEMYDDKGLYVEKYESNSDGIFSVGSFDYTIKSKTNASIGFVVEYEPSFAIPIDDSNKIIEGMDIVKIIYKSSKQSGEKLYSIENALAYEQVIVYPEIITIDDLEYSNTVTEEYDYGAVDCYVYRILIDNSVDKEYIINKISEVMEEKEIKEYQINIMFVDSEQYKEYYSYLCSFDDVVIDKEIKKSSFFDIFNKKEMDNYKDRIFYNFNNGIITSYERIELVKKAGHFYVSVNGDEFDVESYLDGSYKDYYYRDRGYYIESEPKIEETFADKMNDVCHMVIESELGHYFDDKFIFYSNPFHIDENTVGDLEYRLYGNNRDSRCQIVIERSFENGEGVLDLRLDYAVNFALAEANREIDKLILKELPDITILPDYISGCVESDDYENDLVNKEYLKNPIEFQNKYGTDNSVARWLFDSDYDKKKAVKETVEVLEKLGLDKYGVELVFVDNTNRINLIVEHESFEIDESLYFSIHQDGNNLYLSKDMNNIMISYEDVLLDKIVKKEYEDFMDNFVDNSIPYKHKAEDIEYIKIEDTKQEINNEEEELVITLD